ncbi:TRAP transporter small permease subunit [Georgenia subflava]|uniref:TRAP transporter small permease subunit n=1 Tax=Georgenia subflava TaxID=1622177 RepID=A0A6N7EBS0_9MICO|nr:TRAP transporter small permease [Georgenia subflava]MPV35569.1 TRAP transporter small permease subunit [Georgenia subflava]
MKIVDRITHGLGALGGVGVIALMLMTVIDVTLRKLTGRGLGGTIEYSEVVLVACVFLGIAGAQVAGAHVSTSVLTSHLHGRVNRTVRVAAGSVAVLIVVAMVYASAIMAIDSVQANEFRFGLVRVPVWPARILVPIGLFLFLLQFIRGLVAVARDEEEQDSERTEDIDVHL